MPFHNLADPTRKLRRALGMKTILGQDRPDQPFPGLPDDIRKFLPDAGQPVPGYRPTPFPDLGQPEPQLPPEGGERPPAPRRPKLPRPGDELPPHFGKLPIDRIIQPGIPEVPRPPIGGQPGLPAPVPGGPDDGSKVTPLPNPDEKLVTERIMRELMELGVRIRAAKEQLEESFVDGRPGPLTQELQFRLMQLQIQERQLIAQLKETPGADRIPPDMLSPELPKATGPALDAPDGLNNGKPLPNEISPEISERRETHTTVAQSADKNSIGELIKKGTAAIERLDTVIEGQEKQLQFLLNRQKTEPGEVKIPRAWKLLPTIRAVDIFLKAVSMVYKLDRKYLLPESIAAFQERIRDLINMRAEIIKRVNELEFQLNNPSGP